MIDTRFFSDTGESCDKMRPSERAGFFNTSLSFIKWIAILQVFKDKYER